MDMQGSDRGEDVEVEKTRRRMQVIAQQWEGIRNKGRRASKIISLLPAVQRVALRLHTTRQEVKTGSLHLWGLHNAEWLRKHWRKCNCLTSTESLKCINYTQWRQLTLHDTTHTHISINHSRNSGSWNNMVHVVWSVCVRACVGIR